MSRLALAVCVLCLSGAAAATDPVAEPLAIVIFNNTPVDLEVQIGSSGRESVTIGPGQETRTKFHRSQWIHFGMIAYQYVLPDHLVYYAGPATVYLQAESDGNLYFVPPLAGFTASPPRAQPAGFPLRPINTVDLT